MRHSGKVRARHLQEGAGPLPGKWTLLPYVCLVLYALALCGLSLAKPYGDNYFPDETNRLLTVFYYYEHGQLATGAEESVRLPEWGFSYASYPLQLATLLGGLMMKLAGTFTSNPNSLVFAARLVCIAAGTAFVFFAGKTAGMFFPRPFARVFVALVILPQTTFLSIYFNSDIIALCGSAMVLCSWASAAKRGWRMGNTSLLVLGVAIIALSYYNAYSWILLSIIVWFLLWHRQKAGVSEPVQRNRFFGLTLSAIVGAGILILPWFIRSAVLNHGDFLGLSTTTEMSNQYGEGWHPFDERPTPAHLGLSLRDMLTTDHYLGAGNNWLRSTYESFIGKFGWLSTSVPQLVYVFFAVVGIIGLMGCLWRLADWLVHGRPGGEVWLPVTMAVNMVIVTALALQYSYATDYQAQGRYLMPMLLSLSYFITVGIQQIVTKCVKNATICEIFSWILTGVLCGILVYAMLVCYLPSTSPMPPLDMANTGSALA